MEWVNGFPHQKIVLAQLSVENLRFEDKLINDHIYQEVGNSKNGDQHKEAVTSLSLYFWCLLLYISSDWPVAYRMKYWSTLEHWNC